MQLTSPNLDLPRIAHGFFTREGGVSEGIYASLNCGYGSGDEAEKVSKNRATVAAALGQTPEHLCTAHQIHSHKAVIVTKPWHWQDAPQADALVTNIPGIALGVLTADCLPILLAGNGVIASVHAGWRRHRPCDCASLLRSRRRILRAVYPPGHPQPGLFHALGARPFFIQS